MKIQSNVIESTSNMTYADTTRMSIDEGSFQHIVRVLTELYSDPAQSIVREYAANGLDSHVLAGQDQPVQVTFPTFLSPNFVVRDFGVGMSRAEMQNIYSKYGASTKRETNDQIGAFGLGAKSALALVASFTVSAVKDGKRNTVIIAKDEDGVASLNFLDEVETDEPNGVVVKVPVTNVNDFDRVKRLNIFLGWKPGTVLVDGKAPESIHDSSTFADLDGAGWFSTAGHGFGYRGGLRVMVGPVMYEVPFNTASALFASDVLGDWHFGTLSTRLVLNIENGTVALTPSREELIFNRQTKETLREVAARAIPQIFNRLITKIDQAATLRDALRLASEAATFARTTTPIELTWQGTAFHTANTGAFFGKTDWLAAERVENSEEIKNIDHLRIRAKSASAMKASPLLDQKDLHVAGGEFDAYVVITDAERKAEGGYVVAPYLSTWFRNEVKKRDMRVFITTKSAADLDVNFVAMAHTVITGTEVRASVLEARRAAAAARSAQPKAPAAPKVLTVSLMKRARFYNEKAVLDTVEIPSLDQERTYVIIQATSDRAQGPMTLENALYCYFRNNKEISFEQRKAAEAILELINKRKLNLIVLPANANRAAVTEAIENTTTVGEVLKGALEIGTLTEAERAFIAFSDTSSNSWSRFNTEGLFEGGEREHINRIKNASTREFLTLLRKYPSERAGALLTVASIAKQFGDLIILDGGAKTSIALFKNALADTTVRRYPLLTSAITYETAEDAADYINMVDARKR